MIDCIHISYDEALSTEYQALKSENRVLRATNEEFKTTFKKLRAEIRALNTEKETLQARYNVLAVDHRRRSRECFETSDKFEALTAERDMYKTMYRELMASVLELSPKP